MTRRVMPRNPQSGLLKEGYYGFSWTYLFFGGFVPLFRGEWGMAALHLLFTFFLPVISNIIGSFIYNKQYTVRLLEKGYVLHDRPEVVKEVQRRLGVFITADKIEERVTLHAPVSRVWHAITNSLEFGCWFGINLDGEFVVGKPIMGMFSNLPSEAGILNHQKRLGLPPSQVRLPKSSIVFCTPERIEPEHYFSFRWIPYPFDADFDPHTEPTTLVEFRLEAVPEGTLLTIVESGFDRVTGYRRERAFCMNEDGWTAQRAASQ